MANLPETSTWEAGIYQIEETDVVRGGPVAGGGISNTQPQQLGNRTKYLYDQLGRTGITQKTISADTTLTAADLYNKQVMLTVNAANKVVTLDLTGISDGSLLKIAVIKDTTATPPGCVQIAVDSGIDIQGGSYAAGLKSRLWLYLGESVSFVLLGSTLFVTELQGNHDTAGEILYKPFKPPYALEAKGQLVDRAAYPRLFKYAQDNSLTIPDATWLTTNAKKGLFGITGVSTNFRLPDLRGVFMRGLDNGRGLDIDRPYLGEGIYQEDELKSHAHTLKHGRVGGITNDAYGGGWGALTNNPVTESGLVQNAGGIETRAKNIAYTTYIRY